MSVRAVSGCAAALVVLMAVGSASCGGPGEGFDEARARAHVDMLAGTIGSRPVGSPANDRARAYLVEELQRLGFDVRIQETDAVDPARGLTARVRNIIALKQGESDDAVALVSHYDSRVDAPGALDAALGTAICLESARLLAPVPWRRSILVLLTDAEEVGLMGARAAVTDPEIARRVRAFLNFDGTGAAGPLLLFETGPGRGAALDAWASATPAPKGASFTTEIYRRLPNDTDFTVLKTLGASGLNFAPVGDSYAYHTDRDVPGRVRTATIRHGVETAVAVVRALDAREFDVRDQTPTFFDLAQWKAFVLGPMASRLLLLAAVLLGAVSWLLLTATGYRERGMGGLVLTAIWAVLSAAAAGGGLVGAAWALLSTRPELHPWYARPHWFFLFVASTGVLGSFVMGRLAARVPRGIQPWKSPAAVWWATLPVWVGATVALYLFAPTASYLTALPLVSAALLVTPVRRSEGATRAASFVVLVVAAALWAGDTVRLLGFMVPLFGWMPALMPMWVYPAVIGVAGLALAPPAIAVTYSGFAPRQVGMVLVLLWTVSFALAWSSPAYTADRPHRRVVRFVQDEVRQAAWWEAGGNEPGLELPGSGPDAADWRPVDDGPPASVRLARVDKPFRFRSTAQPNVEVPAEIQSVITPHGDHVILSVTVTPRDLIGLQVVLPEGVTPLDGTLAGIVRNGRWTAIHAAVPADGLTVGFRLDAAVAERLADARVVVTVAGLPGGTGWQRLPAWLPTERTTWSARSVFIEPVLR